MYCLQTPSCQGEARIASAPCPEGWWHSARLSLVWDVVFPLQSGWLPSSCPSAAVVSLPSPRLNTASHVALFLEPSVLLAYCLLRVAACLASLLFPVSFAVASVPISVPLGALPTSIRIMFSYTLQHFPLSFLHIHSSSAILIQFKYQASNFLLYLKKCADNSQPDNLNREWFFCHSTHYSFSGLPPSFLHLKPNMLLADIGEETFRVHSPDVFLTLNDSTLLILDPNLQVKLIYFIKWHI